MYKVKSHSHILSTRLLRTSPTASMRGDCVKGKTKMYPKGKIKKKRGRRHRNNESAHPSHSAPEAKIKGCKPGTGFIFRRTLIANHLHRAQMIRYELAS